ncbi:unnamed protein product [Brassica oleracea]
MLLNKTSGAQTRGVISDLFALCPNAKTATEVDKQEIETLIKPHDRTVISGVSSRELGLMSLNCMALEKL